MTAEHRAKITELKGLVKTADIALAAVIDTIHENNLQSELSPEWSVGLSDLRECETTLENFENVLRFREQGLTGEELDNAMFEL